jgi:hypothetical protein
LAAAAQGVHAFAIATAEVAATAAAAAAAVAPRKLSRSAARAAKGAAAAARAAAQLPTVLALREAFQTGKVRDAVISEMRHAVNLQYLSRFHGGLLAQADVDAFCAAQAANGMVYSEAEAPRLLGKAYQQRLHLLLEEESLVLLDIMMIITGKAASLPSVVPEAAMLGRSPGGSCATPGGR